MLNPSTADALKDDPTVRKCIAYAKRWGYGSLEVVNLMAYRATDPAELEKLNSLTAAGPLNGDYFVAACRAAQLIVCAWGSSLPSWWPKRSALSAFSGFRAYYLKLNKDGNPAHPLYLKGDLQPTLWEISE